MGFNSGFKGLMFEDTSDNSNIVRKCTVRNYVYNVTAISFFVPFLDFTTVCLLIIGVEVTVVNDQTQTHTHTHTPSVELVWTSDRPVTETST